MEKGSKMKSNSLQNMRLKKDKTKIVENMRDLEDQFRRSNIWLIGSLKREKRENRKKSTH